MTEPTSTSEDRSSFVKEETVLVTPLGEHMFQFKTSFLHPEDNELRVLFRTKDSGRLTIARLGWLQLELQPGTIERKAAVWAFRSKYEGVYPKMIWRAQGNSFFTNKSFEALLHAIRFSLIDRWYDEQYPFDRRNSEELMYDTYMETQEAYVAALRNLMVRGICQ